MGEAREAIGPGGGDDERVDAARHFHVRLGLGGVEHVHEGFDAGERVEGEGRDEARGRLRHERLHDGPGLAQRAGELGGLVGGDAAGDAEGQPPPLEGQLAEGAGDDGVRQGCARG